MTRRLVHLAICAMLIAGATSAGAQTPAAWGSMSVPGGFSALLRVLAVPGGAEDWRAIPLVIELSFAGPDGLRHTRNIEAYAALLRRLHRQAAGVAGDRRLNLAAARERRKADDLLETLGLEYDRERLRVAARSGRESTARTAMLEGAGLPMTDIAAQLNAGATVSLATRDSVAPLPLGTSFWEKRFDPPPPPQDLLWAILTSREMSSLYYALLGFDDSTLRAMQEDANLTSVMVRHALVLPAIVPALRVREGRVTPAGGAEAAALWQDLVGASLEHPADFVDKLLRAGDGRLAHFYRTVDALPAGTRRWVIGSATAQPDVRRDAFRRLYERFESALGDWRPNAMIEPPAAGPANVLFTIVTQPDGTLAGPPWRDFWRRAFDSDAWPADRVADTGRIDPGRLLDAADLLAGICPDACDRRRLGMFALLQREVATPTIQMAPGLLGVARSRARYPSLALEVQRMRLGDPAPYLRLGSLAARLETLDQPAQAVALVQVQGALALLARLRAVGAPATAVQAHIASLAALPVSNNGFDGGLVRWLVELFPLKENEDLDRAAARLLGGDGWQQPGPAFEWEGETYRVDIAATEDARIRATSERFSVNPLATAATFIRVADGIQDAVSPEAQESVTAAVAAAVRAARDLESVSWTGSSRKLDGFGSLAHEVAACFRKGSAPDRRRLERARHAFRRAADIAAADALAGLVYALALQDVDNPLAISRDLPRRHHLQPQGPAGSRTSAWMLPAERDPEQGSRYISGSLLGFEAALAQLAERRSTSSRPQQEPNMAPALALGLRRTAALAAPWNTRAEDMAAIEEARARGVAVVDTWNDPATIDRALDAAGITGSRAGWMRWSAGRSEKARALVRLEDLVRIGEWSPSTPVSWGTGASPDICLCLVMPVPGWEVQGQSRDADTAAVAVVEPALRVAIELHQRRLPAALAPGVLALLTTDLVEQASLPHQTDFAAISGAVAAVTAHQFDDYIAAVAARGPLVRASNDPRGQR